MNLSEARTQLAVALNTGRHADTLAWMSAEDEFAYYVFKAKYCERGATDAVFKVARPFASMVQREGLKGIVRVRTQIDMAIATTVLHWWLSQPDDADRDWERLREQFDPPWRNEVSRYVRILDDAAKRAAERFMREIAKDMDEARQSNPPPHRNPRSDPVSAGADG